MTEPLLKVDGVDVFHGTFQALWSVSLKVNTGEIVALVGSNSSGKSTLLETISGLLHPYKGNINFDGEDISRLNPFQIVSRGLSQIPEGRKTFPDMTVLENLIIGSYNRNARGKRETSLKRVYELFPRLSERKNQLAKTLSGGEQQMLVIGRGLMSAPKLLMLDEMSLGLAPIVINEIYNVLNEIQSRGITILFVEQNVRRSLQHAQRAYILKTGRVVLSGNVSELQQEDEVKKAYFGV
ncbi:ABC transporter ATP-binding protein [Chloroflexota bacterium]